MGMRETERSLRSYLFIFGGGGLLLRFLALSLVRDRITTVHHGELILYSGMIVGTAFDVLYLAAAVQLRQALASGARWIRHMLIADAVISLLRGALVAAVRGPRGVDVPMAAFTLLLSIYLYRSVVRLAEEAAARAGTPAPPPAAKVV